jgi:membrane protease YdiL (CAAX protease family)
MSESGSGEPAAPPPVDPQLVDPRRCAHCGAPRRASARFCATCGQPLPALASDRDAGAAPEPAPSSATRATHARERVRLRRAQPEGVLHWETFRGAFALWAVMLATIGLGGILATALETEHPALDLAITLVDAVIILAFCWNDRRTLAPLLRASGFTWSTWWCAPLVCALLAGLFEVYFGALQGLGLPLLQMTESFLEAGWPLWTAFALVSLAPGIFEELAFRGVIQTRLAQVMKPGEALLVQAGMFSVLHLSPLIFVSHFAMGVGLGWLRQRTESLYPGMFLHVAWNAFVLLEELR